MTESDGDETPDAELIAAWKAGDQRAASRLVERHANALARFAASSGTWDPAEVDEIVQDTFVKAFGSIDSFRGESTWRTWLISIERRLMLDRRRAGRRRREEEIDDTTPATGGTPLDHLVAGETEQRVRSALETLSPTQRDVFVLRVAEGLSYRDIARIVDTTEGAARVHYHNAMSAIKERLDV